MDNEVKEILMQLVDTTNKLAEGQKQLFDGQKQTNERLDKMDERFDKIDNRLDKMDSRLDEQYNMIYQLTINGEKMQNDIIASQADIKSIRIELENRVSPAIKTLCDMQLDNSERLHNLESSFQKFGDELVIGEVLHGLKENNMI